MPLVIYPPVISCVLYDVIHTRVGLGVGLGYMLKHVSIVQIKK